jgi:hypothetical protein
MVIQTMRVLAGVSHAVLSVMLVNNFVNVMLMTGTSRFRRRRHQ